MAVLGRLHQYNSVPGLRTELDRLYNFLQTMASQEVPAHQVGHERVSTDDVRSRTISPPVNMQNLTVGVGPDVRAVCGFKRYKVASTGDTASSGGVGNLADGASVTVTLNNSATHAINNLTEGDSIVVYRVPWNDGFQLTPFLWLYPGAERLKAVVTNHSGGAVNLPDGNWWVFVTEYCAET